MTSSPVLLEQFSAMRSTDRWGGAAQVHADVAEFERSARLRDGLHTIMGGPAPIDVLLRIKPGRPLVVSFHGNTPRQPDLKLPVFTGLNVTRDLDASFVALCDPSLYLDPELKLGWFAGSSGWNLQAVLKQVLAKIVAIAATDDVVFFGGSGGGYAALYYAAACPGSLALVWNPQTDIAAYNPLQVAEYGKMAFGLPDHETTKAQLPALIESNLASVYDRPRSNQVIYLQCTTDGHVLSHLRPFLSRLGADIAAVEKGATLNCTLLPGMRLFMDKWGDGHVPPSPVSLTQLLEAVVSAAGDWPALLASPDFEELLYDAIVPATATPSPVEAVAAAAP